MTDKQYREYLKTDKWKRIAKKRLEIDGYRCTMCGSKGTALNPIQVHHISYKRLGDEEPRVYQDLLTLCNCCHLAVHNMMNRKTSESGRHGWKDNQHIPNIHVYTIFGEQVESREVEQ